MKHLMKLPKEIISLFIVILTISTAKAQDQNEPIIREVFFTNSEGKRIEGSVKISEKIVFMNIATQYAIGENVLITMDEDEEYFYGKEFLSEGSTITITIKENLQKVKLTIYNPSKKKHVKRRREATGEAPAQDAISAS